MRRDSTVALERRAAPKLRRVRRRRRPFIATPNAGLYIPASLDDSSCVKTITEQEAERHFGKFAEMASAGESILVTHNGQPWVVLQAPRKGGIHSGVAQWPDYPAHWQQHFPDGPISGPTATELLAQEDRF